MMKQKTKIVAIASLIAIMLLPAGVYAGKKKAQNIYVAPDITVDENFYAAGDRVEIAGTINGDLIVAGGIVDVSGSVSGDILAAGGQVRISGPVQGDIRVAGGDVMIEGVIGKNATVFGGDVNMSPDAAIGESLAIAAGSMNLRGTIEKNILGAAGIIFLDASVGKDAKLFIDELVVRQNASIGGDLTYHAPVAAEILSGSEISGEVSYMPAKSEYHSKFDKREAKKAAMFFCLLGLLVMFIMTVILGLVLLQLIKPKLEKKIEVLENDIALSIVWGLIWAVAVPLVSFLLALSIFGLPLAILLMAMYVLVGIVGKIVAILWVGKSVLILTTKQKPKKISLYSSLLLGAALITLTTAIPFIGCLIAFILMSAGIGASAKMLVDTVKKGR